MKPVMQARTGGPDSPPEQHGDCFRACVCSLLELPIGTLDNPSPALPYPDWEAVWLEQLGRYGFWMVGFEVANEGDLWWRSPGYWIASVPSLNLGKDEEGEPIRHAVVMRGSTLAHDPALTQRYSQVRVPTDVLAARLLVPLNPERAAA